MGLKYVQDLFSVDTFCFDELIKIKELDNILEKYKRLF